MPEIKALEVKRIALTKNPAVAQFSAVDETHNLAAGIVLAPEQADGQGHTIGSDAIRQAMHSWAESGNVDRFTAEHDGPAMPNVRAVSWGQAPEKGVLLHGCKEPIPPGAWFCVIETDDASMQMIATGELTGFSVDGVGVIEEDELEVSPKELAQAVVSGVADALGTA